MRQRIEHLARTWSGSCSAELAVAVLGGAWKPSILLALHGGAVLRFGELGRLLGNPAPRVLTRQLRELEEDGLISRAVYAEVPPRVEYRLTELGAGAHGLLTAMTEWGRRYAATEVDPPAEEQDQKTLSVD